MIGMVLELTRAKSHRTVQFPPPDFDSVETTERFPLATGRYLLATSHFEAGSLATGRFPLAPCSFEADSPCSKN